MELKIHKIESTGSTNDWLRTLEPDSCPIHVAVAEYQTAGRGQKGNSWESAPGKNLLFSILIHPSFIDASEQFCLSEIIALSVADAVSEAVCTESADFTVKWPNDIYWKQKKLAGILIENTLQGCSIADCIIGVGLNVNQEEFMSDAPNPVSLRQISGHKFDTSSLLDCIMCHFIAYFEMLQNDSLDIIHNQYMKRLFRKDGLHRYRDAGGEFCASIESVGSNGMLTLRDSDEKLREYEFKQVSYVLPAENE